MLLPEIISRTRVFLSDPDVDGKVWSDEELENCIYKATADLSRMYPREKMLDITLSFTVTDEDISTHASVLATAITLANNMIKPLTDVVKNTAGTTTYTRDTDYTMDYVNGTITPISTGSMVIGTAYHISYTKIKVGFSISSIVDELLKIKTVEYPAGSVPQKTLSFERWGDWVFVTSSDDSQSELSSTSHVFVYYYAEHTPSSGTSHATYPLFLDNVIITGAEAYALYLKVLKLINDSKLYITDSDTEATAANTALTAAASEFTTAKTNVVLALTELGLANAQVDAAITLLALVAAEITSAKAEVALANTQTDSAVTAIGDLADADTPIAAATTTLTGIAAKLTAAETALTAIGTRVTAGVAFLTTGAALINTAPKGENVPENYGSYAQAEIAGGADYAREAEGRLGEATALLQESAQQLENAGKIVEQAAAKISGLLNSSDRYINTANGYFMAAQRLLESVSSALDAANGFISTCDRYIVVCDRYIQISDRYNGAAVVHTNLSQSFQGMAQRCIELSERVKIEANERRSDFITLLRDRTQLRMPTSASDTKQIKS